MNQTINNSQKICPVCQTICNQSVNYCARCGTKFEQNTTTLDTDDKTSLKLVKKHKTKKIVGVIAFSLLAICFLLATIMFAMDLLSQNTDDYLISKLGVLFSILAEICSAIGIISCIKGNKKLSMFFIIAVLLSVIMFFIVGVFTTDDTTSNTISSSSFEDYNISTKDYGIKSNLLIVRFSVPDTWSPIHHSASVFFDITEQINSDNYASVRIASEDNVLSKESLENIAEPFSKPEDYMLISDSWKKFGDAECFDVYYQENANTNRFSRQIILPLEDQKSYFSIEMTSEDKDDLKYCEFILNSASKKWIEQSESNTTSKETTMQTEENVVQDTFNEVTNLTKYDLDGSVGNWSYNGLLLISEECDWIDNERNSEGTVENRAIYRTLAMCMAGFEIGNNYENYAKYILGFTPSTKDEFRTYYDDLKEFICIDDSLKSVIIALDNLDCTKGSFDYNYKSFGKYDFEITDVNQCAKELEISKEMLAYILAMLTDYGTDVTFDGNSCHIKYTSYQ